MPTKLVNTAKTREKLGGICLMTLWRRRQAAPPKPPFPKPVRINGRLYFWDDELDDWVKAEAEAEANNPANIIPNAEEGRAKGRKSLSAKNAA